MGVTPEFKTLRKVQCPGTGLLWRTMGPLPSTLEGLTAEFGMGSGVTPPLKAPGRCTRV